MKKRQKGFMFYIIAFFIPVIVMLVMAYIRKAYPFGDQYSILLGDSNSQYIHFFRIFFDRISEGRSFLFSWDTGMGIDFLTNFWYYLSNPCNWIVLLFGKEHIELGMICAILLQTGGCAVTSMYFFMHSGMNRIRGEKWNEVVCILFSTAYALCDYILAYRFNIMWLMGMMLVPLLMLSMEYLVNKNDGRLYGILLFVGFVANFYFAWFLCIWSVICFVEQEKQDFKHWKKSFIKYIAISVVSALCAAAILIPSYLAVLTRSNKNWYTIHDFSLDTHMSLGNFFNGFFCAHDMLLIGEDTFAQNNYCGIFVLVLFFMYCFNKNIGRFRKIKRIIEIFVFSVAMNWIGASWILHGFTIPHNYTNRYAILLIFLMIMTAFEALYKIGEVRLRFVGITALLLSGIFMLVIFNGDLTDGLLCYLVTMFLIIYYVLCLFLYRNKSISNKAFIISLCIVGFIELLINPFYSNAGSVTYRNTTSKNETAFMDDYNNLEVCAGERKTLDLLSMKNAFSYSQTNIFTSAINSDLAELFSTLGLSDGNAGVSYKYHGTTPLTTVLFNVRYVIADRMEQFGGYTAVGQNGHVYEADDLVGFGFLLPEAVESWDIAESNMFDVQNNFTRDVLGVGDIFTKVAFDQISVESNACELLSYTDEEYHYYNKDAESDSYASIFLTATVPEDMDDLYFYSKSTNRQSCSIYIDGEVFYDDDSMMDDANTYHIGMVHKGQQLEILIADVSGNQGEADISAYFYQYDDTVMQACLEKMDRSVYEIDTFEDTYVSGTIDAAEDGILYTSIPYYKGFTAYVDGKRTDIIKIGNAMAGVRVSEGSHKIEFRYFTYGLKTGITVSAFGILLVSGYMLFLKIRKRGSV